MEQLAQSVADKYFFLSHCISIQLLLLINCKRTAFLFVSGCLSRHLLMPLCSFQNLFLKLPFNCRESRKTMTAALLTLVHQCFSGNLINCLVLSYLYKITKTKDWVVYMTKRTRIIAMSYKKLNWNLWNLLLLMHSHFGLVFQQRLNWWHLAQCQQELMAT